MSLPPVYLATVSAPGYLPMADEPAAFDTASAAWDWLLSERERDLDDPMNDVAPNAEDAALEEMLGWMESPGIGSVWGPTPGSDSPHDLGLIYAVTSIEHADYPHEAGYLYDCRACESRCHCEPGAAECVYGGDHD